jgi:hypothetical protein
MVDTLVTPSGFSHFAVTGHFPRAWPFRGTGTYLPSHYGPDDLAAIRRSTEDALNALDVHSGFVNTDLVMTADGPRVVEVNGRLGGDIATLWRLAGGEPLLPKILRQALGDKDIIIEPAPSAVVSYSAVYQPPAEASRLIALDGAAALRDIPGLTAVAPHRRAGQELDWRRGFDNRLFSAYGVVPDHIELDRTYRQICETVTVTYELGGRLN